MLDSVYYKTCQVGCTLTTFCVSVVYGKSYTDALAVFAHDVLLLFHVAGIVIECYDDGLSERLHVLDMLVEVGKSLLESFAVRLLDVLNWYTAVHLQALSCCYNYSELRLQSALAALDVEELLGTKVGTESSLSDYIFTECHSHLCGEYRVASVCNVGKRTTVYECCSILSGLYDVRSQSVAQKDCYGSSYAEVLNGDRLALNGVAQEDVLNATTQVVLVLSKTENSHNL